MLYLDPERQLRRCRVMRDMYAAKGQMECAQFFANKARRIINGMEAGGLLTDDNNTISRLHGGKVCA